MEGGRTPVQSLRSTTTERTRVGAINQEERKEERGECEEEHEEGLMASVVMRARLSAVQPQREPGGEHQPGGV